MRGITEERLEELLEDIPDNMAAGTIKRILDKCEELSPWQLIETAPMEKEVLVYDKTYGCVLAMFIWGAWRNADRIVEINPTHWLDLPEPPR